MEQILELNIIGEILIPFDNGAFLNNKEKITFKDLNDCTFKQFRSVLFQGELLKLYIVIKTKKKEKNIKKILERINFIIEFISTKSKIEDTEFNNQTSENMCSVNFFTLNIESETNYEDVKYEYIKNREYDELNSCEIYEVIKQITVPEELINNNLIMKVNIVIKSDDYYSYKNENIYNNISEFYQSGYLNNCQEYLLLKSLFKEIKILNPLNLKDIKQLEPKIDITLLETVLNFLFADNLFYDFSLKSSKIFKNIKNIIQKNENRKIFIKNIRILHNETIIDEKLTLNYKTLKENTKQFKKYLKDFEISLMGNQKYPIILNAGEEYTLLLKIIKKNFVNDIIINTNKTNENNREVIIVDNSKNNSQSELFRLNTLSDNSIPLIKKIPSKDSLTNNTNDTFQSYFRLTSKVSQLINTNSIEEEEITDSNMDISNLNLIDGEKISSENENEKSSNMLSSKQGNYNNKNINQDNFFIICYITPVVLDLSSELFYEDFHMCIQMRWFCQIDRYLSVKILIPENIFINEYFCVTLKIKNISDKEMNLVIQVKDNEVNEINSNSKVIENVPAILSRTKIEHLGVIESNDEKSFIFNFLPLTLDYCLLPNFLITDFFSDKQFCLIQKYQIFVKDKKDDNN